jgi:hypothetical protein
MNSHSAFGCVRWRTLCLIALILLVTCACGENADKPEGDSAGQETETFTFFDLGRHSRFSERIREELSEKLGNDAIEHRSIIDLEMNYKGFLKAHLPEMDALNRELNDPPGERVDHDVIKLMYRYARKKNAPFDYIELMFDGHSRMPLVFRIRFEKDEAGTVEALRSKYGPPQVITWGAEGGRSLVWRKKGDYLIVSLVPDQFRIPEHHISMVFTENLKGLIASEQALKENRNTGKSVPEKRAF